MIRLLVFLLLFASLARAEVNLPDLVQVQTQAGVVQVRPVSQYEQQLFAGGVPLAGIAGRRVHIKGVYNHAQDGSQSVLAQVFSGGNGCFDVWVVLRIVGPQITPIGPFGGCAESLTALRVLGDGIELDIGVSNPRFSHATFHFSGRGFTRSEVPAQAQGGAAGMPFAAGPWVGKGPYELLRDPAGRGRFLAVLPVEVFDRLAIQVSVSSGMFSDGIYLFGNGCVPHQCNRPGGAFAVRRADGKIFAVVQGVAGPELHGGTFAEAPWQLQRFMQTGTFPR